MFTGIVTDIGDVLSVKARADDLHRLKIACGYPRLGIADGASIACSGVCLTVVGAGEEDGRTWFAADAAALFHSSRAIGADGIDALEGLRLEALTEKLTSLGREPVGEDSVEFFARA